MGIFKDMQTLRSNALTAGYSGFMAEIAGKSIPAEQSKFVNETLDAEAFTNKMDEFISSILSVEEFNANGERLKKEYIANGYIKDVETGEKLSTDETMRIFRIYGLCKAVQDKSQFILESEALTPDDIQIKNLEETLKIESKELEDKLGKESTEFVRKKAEELQAMREEIRALKDRKEEILEDKIKKVCDIFYQIIRIFNIANITSKLVGGTILTTLAADPFTKAFITHPAVIAAIVVDIIWIIGPKNIPIIKEMWELMETLIAKIGVQANNIVVGVFNGVKAAVNKVKGDSGKQFGEAIFQIDPDELKARLERSNKIPEVLKDIVKDNKDVSDLASQVWKKVTVDLKKDAIASDADKKAAEDEVTKIKTSITDDILKNMGKDDSLATGLMGKLATDEVAVIPNEEPTDTSEPTATGEVAEDGKDSDDDGTTDNMEPAEIELVKDDTSDEEDAEKQIQQIQESPLYKRRQEVMKMFGGAPKRETSYIESISETVLNATVLSILSESEE